MVGGGCATNRLYNTAMESTNKEMQEQLEQQLHKQYAINNNSNVSSFVAMIGALMIVFTGYGYVLIKFKYPNAFNADLFDLITVVTVFVIAILYCIAVQLGSAQRMEQFITYAIRCKYYDNNPKKLGTIYPNGYAPFNKHITNYIQGVYNTITYILFICSIATIILSGFYVAWDFEWFVWLLLSVIIYAMLQWNVCQFTKYKKREKEYRNKLPKNVVEPISTYSKITTYVTFIVFSIITLGLGIFGLCYDGANNKILLICIIASSIYAIISTHKLYSLCKE